MLRRWQETGLLKSRKYGAERCQLKTTFGLAGVLEERFTVEQNCTAAIGAILLLQFRLNFPVLPLEQTFQTHGNPFRSNLTHHELR